MHRAKEDTMKRHAFVATAILSGFLSLAASAADEFNLDNRDRSDQVGGTAVGIADESFAQSAEEFGLTRELMAEILGGAYPALCGEAAHPAPNAPPLVKMIFRMLQLTGRTLQCDQGAAYDRIEGDVGSTVLQ